MMWLVACIIGPPELYGLFFCNQALPKLLNPMICMVGKVRKREDVSKEVGYFWI